jgi:hypothetical protein
MDDIGNLVYVLVFIVWFLSRIFGKKGKKAIPKSPTGDQNEPESSYPERRVPSESTTPPVTFEDILRELTGVPPATRASEPEVEQEFETYYSDDVPETSFEVLEPELEIPPKSIYKIPKLKEKKSKKQQSSKAARQAVKMLRSKQGARQAFIMKEIFDRKY